MPSLPTGGARVVAVVLTTAALAAVAAGSIPSGAAAAPAARRAPSGAAFYRPPSPLPKGRHGDLIWARSIASPTGPAARTMLVLYRSTGAGGRAVAVSGTVSVPRGKAPRGGWPIVSWAHGTTGIADVCAPSLTASTTTSSIQLEAQTWLKLGFAVARTDYAGLGTPGTHPYLMGSIEGRNVVDAVRAARQIPAFHVGSSWISAGHSEGGQAALFAGSLARSWAPELTLRGVAAFAPASHIIDQAKAVNALNQPSPLTGYGALIVTGAAAGTPSLDLDAIESDQARALQPQVETKCLQDLEAPDSFGALAPADLFKPGADLTPLYHVLGAQNPDVAIPVPVLMTQGSADTTVFRTSTDALVEELRGKHDKVDYKVYDNVNHVDIVKDADARMTAWLKERAR